VTSGKKKSDGTTKKIRKTFATGWCLPKKTGDSTGINLMRVVQPDPLVIEHSYGSYGLQEDLGKSSQNSPRVIPSIDGLDAL